VQEAAQRAWDERIALRERLTERPELDLDLDAIFDLGDATRWAGELVGRLDALPTETQLATMYSALWELASDAVNWVRRAAPQGSTHGRVWDPA